MPIETGRLRVEFTSAQAASSTSAVLLRPRAPVSGPEEAQGARKAAFVLAHGAGTDRTHPFQQAVARGLAERGHPAVLFNFGYTEAGRRRPDPMARLEAAYRDVAAAARARLPGRPLVLGGRSMGGRVASHLAAAGEACDGLVFLGYPLHPAGRPERLRTEHWPRITVPVLFVTGERDRLCDLALLEAERRRLAAVDHRLHVVAGADHGFKVRASDRREPGEVVAEVTETVAGWTAAVLAAGTRA